jgi:hypothetical protein
MKNEKKKDKRRMVGFYDSWMVPIDRAYEKDRKIQGRNYAELEFMKMLVTLGMAEYQKKVGK